MAESAENQRKCEGYGCGRTAENVPFKRISFDPQTGKDLCNDCWVKVDPAHYRWK